MSVLEDRAQMTVLPALDRLGGGERNPPLVPLQRTSVMLTVILPSSWSPGVVRQGACSPAPPPLQNTSIRKLPDELATAPFTSGVPTVRKFDSGVGA